MVVFKIYIELIAQDRVLKLLGLIKVMRKEERLENESMSGEYLKQGSKELVETEAVVSLNPSHNIFLKDDNLQPAPHNDKIGTVKVLARVLILALVLTLVILPLRLQSDLGHINSTTSMENYFI
jgi:hypothetical protein